MNTNAPLTFSMYRLTDFLHTVAGVPAERVVSNEVFACETDPAITVLTNTMRQSLACHTFTLVLQGYVTTHFNGSDYTLHPGDLYIYAPGYKLTVDTPSDDYRGVCFMVDEGTPVDANVAKMLVHLIFDPVVETGHPVIHLDSEAAAHVERRIREVIAYLHAPHRFRTECLRNLHTLFLLDLLHFQQEREHMEVYSDRSMYIFMGFVRLISKHFVEEHEVAFYAATLGITPTHLSRVVKQVSGRTVGDHIAQLLMMEALYLLHNTDLSINDVAERLNFASASGFGKFFKRYRGITPRQERGATEE